MNNIKRTQTTEIKKKYKDKKTGEWKEITINHAKVKDRLLNFWAENPRGKIETSSIRSGEVVTFKTFILADKAEPYSKEATGHSMGEVKDEKSFEKLETISVGRALALLGYMASGEIASSEEMEEFERFQSDKKAQAKSIAIEMLEGCKSLAELKTTFQSLGGFTGDRDVIAKKDELKAKLK